MKSSCCLSFAGTLLFVLGLILNAGISSGADLASVNGDVITSDEYVTDYRVASTGGEGTVPDTTAEGKREFLDRVVAKHLLSQYFHNRGWDTLSYWDTLLAEYEQGQYLQALYHEAIPEARTPVAEDVRKLMELSKAYVDSLQKAYHLTVDEKAVVFIGDRSVVRNMSSGSGGEQPQVVWHELFTDEEKKMPVARLEGGVLTLGELVSSIETMPAFARPTGGNTDQIALTIEHFGREKVFELEFNKLGLRDKPFFSGLIKKKREGVILDEMFVAMQDTITVTDEAVREYYDAHRDDFMTVPTVNLAVMRFTSEEVAKQAAKRIEEGQDFESVAVDFSIYSGNEKGFDVTGFVDRGKGGALFDAIWEKPIGSTAGPIADEDSWKVAKLLDRKDPRLLSLEEATPMIVDRLRFLGADAALTALIAELRSNAKIVVYDDALQAIALPHVGN